MSKQPRATMIGRVLAVLARFSDGRPHRLDTLARDLGVCERTIRRDIQALEIAGFIVQGATIDAPRYRVFQLVDPAHGRAVSQRIAKFRGAA